MSPLTHLFINECELLPGSEWKDSSAGWKIVLLTKGYFYWIARADIRELQKGDVLVIGPSVDGVLRASQLSRGSLHFFCFQPEHLMGLMSVSERLSLNRFAETNQTRIISAGDLTAQEFGRLTDSNFKRRSFFYRCRLLHLVAMIFGHTEPSSAEARTNVATAWLRFEELIARIPDTDLLNYSSAKLAEMCGCSLRHFRRMFHQHYKTSIRAKQTEMRLEKARHLLAETDQRILSIARESGYRHMGFFNTMFKRKFGVTPSEWRRQNTTPNDDCRNGASASSH